jgi:hypothetical protein
MNSPLIRDTRIPAARNKIRTKNRFVCGRLLRRGATGLGQLPQAIREEWPRVPDRVWEEPSLRLNPILAPSLDSCAYTHHSCA